MWNCWLFFPINCFLYTYSSLNDFIISLRFYNVIKGPHASLCNVSSLSCWEVSRLHTKLRHFGISLMLTALRYITGLTSSTNWYLSAECLRLSGQSPAGEDSTNPAWTAGRRRSWSGKASGRRAGSPGDPLTSSNNKTLTATTTPV